MEIPDFTGAPFWVRVFATLALWFFAWAAVWVRPNKEEKEGSSTDTKIAGPYSPVIHTGDNSPVTFTQVVTGVGDEEQSTRIAEKVLEKMRATTLQKKDEISLRFPLGYAVFGITEAKQIVPLKEPNGNVAHVNWGTAKILEISSKEITVSLPDVTFESGDMLQNCALILPRISGATFYFWSLEPGHHTIIKNLTYRLKPPPLVWDKPPVGNFETPTMVFVVEIVSTEAAGDVVVFGLKPYKNPRQKA